MEPDATAGSAAKTPPVKRSKLLRIQPQKLQPLHALTIRTHETASATKACSMKCVSTPQPSISVRRAAG